MVVEKEKAKKREANTIRTSVSRQRKSKTSQTYQRLLYTARFSHKKVTNREKSWKMAVFMPKTQNIKNPEMCLPVASQDTT